MGKISCHAADTRPADNGNGVTVKVPFSKPAGADYQRRLRDIFNLKQFGPTTITADYVEVTVHSESAKEAVWTVVQDTVDIANGDKPPPA